VGELLVVWLRGLCGEVEIPPGWSEPVGVPSCQRLAGVWPLTFPRALRPVRPRGPSKCRTPAVHPSIGRREAIEDPLRPPGHPLRTGYNANTEDEIEDT
jgi:hypothetical protein